MLYSLCYQGQIESLLSIPHQTLSLLFSNSRIPFFLSLFCPRRKRGWGWVEGLVLEVFEISSSTLLSTQRKKKRFSGGSARSPWLVCFLPPSRWGQWDNSEEWEFWASLACIAVFTLLIHPHSHLLLVCRWSQQSQQQQQHCPRLGGSGCLGTAYGLGDFIYIYIC